MGKALFTVAEGDAGMETTAGTTAPARLTIDIWVDVLCPWCYLGEHRLQAAVAQSPHAAHIDLRVHTFQLDPGASTEVVPILDYLARKFDIPVEQARLMEERVAMLATTDGLPYVLHRPASSTFDMLRLIHLGSEHGVAWRYLTAMQHEVFSGNFEAFAHDTLARLGEELGIPGDEIRDVLATDRYADAVRADHREAVRLGARGVPFTVLGQRIGIPGAVSTSQFAELINRAWDEVKR